MICAAPLVAQQSVRGVVLAAATTDSLPFSVVSLTPGYTQRLSDAHGRFFFPDVRPGTYRLVVRQIAHVPFDTTLIVGAVALPALRVTLQRVAITLPPVTVRGTLECRRPGAPDPGISANAAAVFEQAAENARRYRLLADSFPHRSLVERTLLLVTDGQRRITKVDTLGRESGSEWRYQPGRLVADGAGARRGELMVRMWSLGDFADSAFVRHHCFRLAGRDTLGGATFVRLDFQPPRSFGEMDVEGSAYLDSLTYVVRHTVVRLTQPRQRLTNVADMVARTEFRLVAPWIVVHDRLSAVTRLVRPRGTERIEEQRLLDVHFARPLELADP
jgi:hypothetical protein